MKQADASSPRLPNHVQDLFWDYDSGAVEWDHDRDLIIRRVLSEGSWDAVTWLRDRLGDDELRRWIENTRGRSLSRRQLRFWEVVLDLPSDRVDAWIAGRPHAVWDERTGT